MHRLPLLFAALLSLPLLGSDSPKEFDSAMAISDPLEGSWQVTEVSFNGKEVSFRNIVLEFRGGNYTETGGKRQDIGTYKIDHARQPGRLDMLQLNGGDEGRTFKYIYRIDGDVLKLATRPGGKLHPQEFQEESLLLFSYKRVRK